MLKDYNDFYLKTTWLDKLIYNIILFICFKNNIRYPELKSYLNKRLLLKILKNSNNHLVYTENYNNTLYFRLDDCYYISYNVELCDISLKQGLIYFINYHHFNEDNKITKEIIEILKSKYHEHQSELIKQASHLEEEA